MRGDEVVSVRGDADDVFSHGFLCPKSQGLKQLHDDPDRLTAPLVRRDGELVEASWEEAFAAVDEGLSAALAEGGRDAVAVYIGNPGRPQPRPDALRRAADQGAGDEERLHRLDRRPDAEAGLVGADVRRRPQRPGPRRRPHRPPADPRRQPAGLQRLAAHGARHARAASARSASAAARSWSSTRAAAGPRRRPPSTTSSVPGTDAHLLFAIANVLIAEGLADPGRLAEHAERRRRDRRRSPSRSSPRRWRPCAGSRRPRSAAWHASWRPPRAPPSTRGSGPRPSASARSRAGSSTSSTTSPATSTARAGRCSRSPPPASATPPAPAAPAAAFASGVGRAGSAAAPRSSASCRWSGWRRRSRPRARARCGRW